MLPLVREGVITQNEYDLFRHKARFSEFITRSGNRIYIDISRLGEMRDMIQPPTRSNNKGTVFEASEDVMPQF